jgi:hypothetical protein
MKQPNAAMGRGLALFFGDLQLSVAAGAQT